HQGFRLPRRVMLGTPAALDPAHHLVMLASGRTGTFSVDAELHASRGPPSAVDGPGPLAPRGHAPPSSPHLTADAEHLLEVHVTGMV
ncbi:hypothetical protein ACLESO_60100, partial [Pyxidicoccus sp. 3LG]